MIRYVYNLCMWLAMVVAYLVYTPWWHLCERREAKRRDDLDKEDR